MMELLKLKLNMELKGGLILIGWDRNVIPDPKNLIWVIPTEGSVFLYLFWYLTVYSVGIYSFLFVWKAGVNLSVYRIIDANINRVSEGLRVIEDIERFIFEDAEISRELREIRHLVRKGFPSTELIKSREASKDVGLKTSKESSLDRKESIEDLIVSNFKRVEEGLRSIEECLKIIEYYEESKAYEELRFRVYTLEKKVFLNMKKDETDFKK